MTPLGHAGISLLLGVGLTKVVNGVDPTLILGSVVAGGISLDLDLLYSFYKRGFKALDIKAGSHRFYPTHTPLFATILGLTVALFNFEMGLFFLVGALIHLILDTLFFPEGINFTYPINKQRVTLFTVKSNNKFLTPKPIAGVENWKRNYLTSLLFWLFEFIPTLLAIALATPILYKA